MLKLYLYLFNKNSDLGALHKLRNGDFYIKIHCKQQQIKWEERVFKQKQA